MRTVMIFCFLLTATICKGQQIDNTTTTFNSSENLKEKTTEELEKIKDELEKKGRAKEMLAILLVLEERIRKENGIKNKKYIESLSELSFTYEGLGDYENAEIYYLKTLNAAKDVLGEESSTYILNLCYFGDFMKNKGDDEKAEYYLLKAFEAGKDKRDDFDEIREYAGLYGFLANYYRSIADYSKALPLYLEELTIFEQENEERNQEYSATLSNLSDLYNKIAHHEKALFYSIKSVELTEKYHGKDNFGYGQRVNNLAILYANTGNHLKADSLYKISIENALSLLGNKHHEYALRLFNSGLNNRKLKNYSKAEQEVGKALTILQNILPDNHRIIKNAKSKYASTLFHIGEHELAANQLIEALNLNIKGKEDFKLGASLHLQWILEIEGFEEIAERYYLGCNEEKIKDIKNTFEYLSENEQFKFSRSFQLSNALLESYAFRNKDKINLREACVNNEILWKGLLLENKKRLRNAIESNFDEDLRLKYLEWQELKKSLAKEYKLPISKRSKNFKTLVYKEEDLEGFLSRESVNFRKAQKRVDWKNLSSSLKEDEIILEFSDISYFKPASRERTDSVFYVVYLIKKDLTTPVFIPLFEAKDLLKTKRTSILYRFDKGATNNSLYSKIWKKIETEMEGIQTIYYSPSGLLNKINFSAIPINQTETIGDKFILHNMGSTRQIVFPEEKPIYQITNATIYGGIDYLTDTTKFVQNKPVETEENLVSRSIGKNYRSLRGEDWDYLEWTNKEAEDITKTLEKNNAKVTLFKGKEATEESFKNIGVETPSPRILHLATHGYFFPDPKKDAKTGFRASEHPLIRSGLILAGANNAWKGGSTPPGKEDGILTAYEIAQMDLSNTELVVLSACNTGLGDIEGNEGVYGLQRAFKMAGAKYILMSLWRVDDKKTYEFMTRFYELYQTEGKSIPEAYQMTQNEMRKKYALPFNPRNWAGFVLVQ